MGILLPIPNFKFDDHTTWPPLLPLYVVAKILSLSPWTLRQWDKDKKFSAIRVGKRGDRMYKKEDLVKVLSQGIIVTG